MAYVCVYIHIYIVLCNNLIFYNIYLHISIFGHFIFTFLHVLHVQFVDIPDLTPPRPGRFELSELSSNVETLDVAPETPLRNFSYLLVPWCWIGQWVTGTEKLTPGDVAKIFLGGK